MIMTQNPARAALLTARDSAEPARAGVILFLKAGFKHKAGYVLQGFPPRWHKVERGKPVPKKAIVAAHPKAAGEFAPAKHLTDDEWGKLKLPAENVNAPTFNKQLDNLRKLSESGNVTGILAQGYGVNTYGKKLALIANHLLGLHGTEHKVASGQKAGEHAAVQVRPAPLAAVDKPSGTAAVQSSVQDPDGKTLTAKQKDIVTGIEKYLGFSLAGTASYIKNSVVTLDISSLNQQQIHAIENYGIQFGHFETEPGGFKKISLVMPKGPSGDSGAAPAAAAAPAPEPAPVAAEESPIGKQVMGKDLFKLQPGTIIQITYDGKPWRRARIEKGAIYFEKAKGSGWQKNPLAPQHVSGMLGDEYGTYTIVSIPSAAEPKAAETKPAPAAAPPAPPAPPSHGVDFDALVLPDSNSNAPGINKKVAALKAAAEAGDAAAVEAIKTGTNTYNKKIEAAKQKILFVLGGAPAPAAAPDPAPKVAKVEAVKPTQLPPKLAAEAKAAVEAKVAAAAEAKPTSSITLHHTSDGHNKFYTVTVDGSTVNTHYGKIGTAGVKGSKEYPSPAHALSAAHDLTLSKQKKGYFKFDGGLPASIDAAPAVQQLAEFKAVAGNAGYGIFESNKKGYLATDKKTGYIKTFANIKQAEAAVAKLQAAGLASHMSGNHPYVVMITGKSADPVAPAATAKPKTVSDIAIPDFGDGLWDKRFALMAQAVKKAVEEKGKAGFSGMVTFHKTGYKAGGFTVKAPVENGKIGKAFASDKMESARSKKMHAFIAELSAASGKSVPPKVQKVAKVDTGPKEGDTKMGADGMLVLKHGRWVKVDQGEPSSTAAPAKAPPPSMKGWTKIGGKKGTNPGALYKTPDGQSYYVKFPPDPDHAHSEVLAAALYQAVGIETAETHIVDDGGKIGIASKWRADVAHAPGALSKGEVADVKAGFAVDAWLANWDVAGQTFDNVMRDASGKPVRIDVGGSLQYRAQGETKELGPTVPETKSLLDPKINEQSAAMFAGITEADITAGVAKIASIDDADIKALVDLYGPGDQANKDKLAATLIARKQDLIKQYPKAAKAIKKQLNIKRLPVDPSRLPKRHDFANWNGAGKGLSSKEHVNAANSSVEDEMLAIAKKGDLPALRAFKFKSLDKETGKATGAEHPISEHPSKHVVQFHQDLVTLLDEVANPPEPLKLFTATEVSTVDAIHKAFPPKPFGTTVGKVKSNEKLGFWVGLGQVSSIESFKPKEVSNFTSSMVSAAKAKYQEASALAKHFISSVQASGSYNTLFRDGKEKDHSGYKLTDVAKAALEHATSHPEGTSVYRWQNMTDAMVQAVMKTPVGTVIQATGPMCTSYDSEATKHFGKHRVTIRYAKGAKAVESFASGKFKGEKEVTTLPNSRFVVLSKEMVGSRLELELLMLPPDLGISS